MLFKIIGLRIFRNSTREGLVDRCHSLSHSRSRARPNPRRSKIDAWPRYPSDTLSSRSRRMPTPISVSFYYLKCLHFSSCWIKSIKTKILAYFNNLDSFGLSVNLAERGDVYLERVAFFVNLRSKSIIVNKYLLRNFAYGLENKTIYHTIFCWSCFILSTRPASVVDLV